MDLTGSAVLVVHVPAVSKFALHPLSTNLSQGHQTSKSFAQYCNWRAQTMRLRKVSALNLIGTKQETHNHYGTFNPPHSPGGCFGVFPNNARGLVVTTAYHLVLLHQVLL